MQVDLHLHSFYSDGTLSPTALVARAKNLGLDAAVLTDHDTDFGSDEFVAAAEKLDLATVRGFEMTTYDNAEVHILGYACPKVSESPILAETFSTIREAKKIRNESIVTKLNELGINVTLEEIVAGGTRAPSRSHIAGWLVNRGMCPDLFTAYVQYLGKNARAYVPFQSISSKTAVSAITTAGGRAVLAHPGRLKMSEEQLDSLVARLVKEGLVGIESYYMTHTTDVVKRCLSLCEKYNLFSTNGSDFHCEKDSGIHGGDAKYQRTSLDELTRLALGLHGGGGL